MSNLADCTITIIIEPWAEEIELQAGSNVIVIISANEIGIPEFHLGRNIHTIWVWRNCTARLIVDGVDCTPPSLRLPAPG